MSCQCSHYRLSLLTVEWLILPLFIPWCSPIRPHLNWLIFWSLFQCLTISTSLRRTMDTKSKEWHNNAETVLRTMKDILCCWLPLLCFNIDRIKSDPLSDRANSPDPDRVKCVWLLCLELTRVNQKPSPCPSPCRLTWRITFPSTSLLEQDGFCVSFDSCHFIVQLICSLINPSRPSSSSSS